jgi:hypothetical protein
VGVQDTLGVGSGPRGVHHDREIGWGNFTFDGLENCFRHRVGDRVVESVRPVSLRVAEQDDAAQIGRVRKCQPAIERRLGSQLRPRGFEPLGDVDAKQPGRCDKEPDIGEPDHLGDLRRAVQGAQRHGERADAGYREPPDDPVGPVGEEQPDPRALADTLLQQPACDIRRARLRFPVGETVIGRHQIGSIAELTNAALEKRGDRRVYIGHTVDLPERRRQPFIWALPAGHAKPTVSCPRAADAV